MAFTPTNFFRSRNSRTLADSYNVSPVSRFASTPSSMRSSNGSRTAINTSMESSLDSCETSMQTPPFNYHQSQFDESRSDSEPVQQEHATMINYSGLLSMIQEHQARLQELSSSQEKIQKWQEDFTSKFSALEEDMKQLSMAVTSPEIKRKVTVSRKLSVSTLAGAVHT